MAYLAAAISALWARISAYLPEISAAFAALLISSSRNEAKQQEDRADALQARMDVNKDVDAMSDAAVHKRLYDDFGPRGLYRVDNDKRKW